MWVALSLIFLSCSGGLVLTAWYETSHDRKLAELEARVEALDAEAETLDKENEVLTKRSVELSRQVAMAFHPAGGRRLHVASDGAKLIHFPNVS